MVKEFNIDGVLTDHSGTLSEDIVINLFISWVEAHGMSFGGSVYLIKEDIKEPINKVEQDEFNDDICCGGMCSCNSD